MHFILIYTFIWINNYIYSYAIHLVTVFGFRYIFNVMEERLVYVCLQPLIIVFPFIGSWLKMQYLNFGVAEVERRWTGRPLSWCWRWFHRSRCWPGWAQTAACLWPCLVRLVPGWPDWAEGNYCPECSSWWASRPAGEDWTTDTMWTHWTFTSSICRDFAGHTKNVL